MKTSLRSCRSVRSCCTFLGRKNSPFKLAALFNLLGLLLCAGSGRAEENLTVADDLNSPEESPQGAPPVEQGPKRVFKDRISPHWFHQNTRFWYRNNLRDDGKEFIVVDAERGTREAALDHAKLASALSKAAGSEYKAGSLPFDRIEFVDDNKAIRFKVGETAWKCSLNSYECAKTEAAGDEKPDSETDVSQERRGRRQPQSDDEGDGPERSSGRSPDGKWTAMVKEYNVFIKSRDDEAKEIQLSTDGNEGLAYARLSWSPDSKTLAAFRVEPGERKEVYLVESSPKDGGRAKLQTRTYPLPGDKFTQYEVNVFEVATRKQTKPEVDRLEHEWLRPRVR